MHLLAVSPTCRGRGIGGALIEAAVNLGQRQGYSTLVLWTQPTMEAAQRLYRAAGFTRQSARDFQGPTGRQFLVFQRPLAQGHL
jgi:ribosomal protein S18 acetylase RimI-like enzyme